MHVPFAWNVVTPERVTVQTASVVLEKVTGRSESDVATAVNGVP